MNLSKYSLLILAFACLTFSGCDKSSEDPDPITTEPVDSSDAYDPAPQDDPTGMFDYSKLTDHPRLFMNEEDFAKLTNIVNHKSNETILQFHNRILETCESNSELAPLTYVKNGTQILDVSRKAVNILFSLSYGYRMTGKPKYLIAVVKQLNAVCSFPDWNATTEFLDAAEMATAVSIAYDWLYPYLPSKTRKMVFDAVKKNVFDIDESYLWWLTRNTNHNQVDNSGLVMSAIALYEYDKNLAKDIIERSITSNAISMEAYDPDGAYPEGYNYWGYGTGYEVMLLTAMQKAFGTTNGLAENASFLKTAEYILYTVGSSGEVFDYADCPDGTQSVRFASWWFGLTQNRPDLLYNEATLMTHAYSDIKLPFVQSLLVNYDQDPLKEYKAGNISKPTAKLWAGDGITPVVLVRTGWDGNDSDRYLGIKGGKATSTHAHMDAGNFVYDALGQRWAKDLGMEAYVPIIAAGVDLWSVLQASERWNVFRISNEAHNTVIFDGKNQINSGNVTLTKIETSTELGAEMNMTPAFSNSVTSYTRTVVLENEKDLKVVDSFTTNSDTKVMDWQIVTEASPTKVSDNCYSLNQYGKTVYLKFDAPIPITLKEWSTVGTHSYDSPNTATRVGFEATLAGNTSYTFTATISETNQ